MYPWSSGEGDLEPFSGELSLHVEGWQKDKVLSLREAAQLLNPLNEFQSSCCNCKSGCQNKRCVCRQKGSACGSKCHGGHSCSNTAKSPSPNSESNGQLKRKKHRIATIVISSEEEEEEEDDNKWLPELGLNINDKEIVEEGGWLTDKHIQAAHIRMLVPYMYVPFYWYLKH